MGRRVRLNASEVLLGIPQVKDPQLVGWTETHMVDAASRSACTCSVETPDRLVVLLSAHRGWGEENGNRHSVLPPGSAPPLSVHDHSGHDVTVEPASGRPAESQFIIPPILI